MSTSRAFLRGIVDYAGLFPPASLPMSEAVTAYGEFRRSDERDLLGRFIVPVSRLGEFSSERRAQAANETDATAWRLSVIASASGGGSADAIAEFNRTHGSLPDARAFIDCVEMPVANIEEALTAIAAYGRSFELFLEPSPIGRADEILNAISGTGAALKIRTGGVTLSAFPAAAAVIGFIDKCAARGIRFKATAGLHHALRGSFPLTYEQNAPSAVMFGYVNVFLVAAFRRTGLREPALIDLLEESDPASIFFNEVGVHWRGNLVSAEDLEATRKSLAISFGSCSFTEPVAEARELHLL